ncbi:hypothetical protein FRB98_006131 [Tulasnella sp. 332]|nr:hypothetical protein FRB98_006131 [Tulasnella sp. 332]
MSYIDDIDFYNRYSDAIDTDTYHQEEQDNANVAPIMVHDERPHSQAALSALSAILLNAGTEDNRYEGGMEQGEEDPRETTFGEDNGGGFEEDPMAAGRAPFSEDDPDNMMDHEDLDPTVRYSTAVGSGSVASGSGGSSSLNPNHPTSSSFATVIPTTTYSPPNAMLSSSRAPSQYSTTNSNANWHPEPRSTRSSIVASITRQPSSSSASSHNHSTTPTLPPAPTHNNAYPHQGGMSRSNSNATSSAHSSGYASTFPSNITTATTASVSLPPSRSNSNTSPNTKSSLSSQAYPSSSSSNGLPYSEPIPRPHKAGQSSTYRASAVSGGSTSPPSLVRGASGSPPLSAVAGGTGGYGASAKRRQSGLRSSIVSGDVEWERAATDEDVTSDQQHGGHSIEESGRARARSTGSHGDRHEGATASIGLGMLMAGITTSNLPGPRSGSPGPYSSLSSFPGGAQTRGSSFHSGAASAASRPPSSYQDSGRGSGYGYQHTDSSLYSPYTADTSVASSPEITKRPTPSLHSRPSRSNLQQQQQQQQPVGGSGLGSPLHSTAGTSGRPGVARSPSSGSSPTKHGAQSLGRSPSAGMLSSLSGGSVNKSASTSNLIAMRNGSLSPSHGIGGSALSRSNSHRSIPIPVNDSPEPPVPPLPRSAAPSRGVSTVDQDDGEAAIGMAATVDQPVHLSNRVARSRASSVNAMNPPAPTNLASPTPLFDGGVRTSWANHHLPPLTSQRSNDWTPSPVEEHPEHEGPEHERMSASCDDDLSTTDLDSMGGDDDQDHTYNSSNSLGSHQNHQQKHYRQHHPFETPEQRYSSVYNARSSTAMGNTAPMRPDTNYSVAGGEPGGGDEWDGEAPRRERENTAVGYRQAASRALTETDVSEVDESEYGDDDGASKETGELGYGMEERTAAVILAEEGGGLIVNVSGGSISGLEIKRGTTHIVMSSTTSPSEVPTFLATFLPLISDTLLALDISSNALTSLPEALGSCTSLEELNIGSNPLKVLPTWLSGLSNLQVLIVDATEISTIPPELSRLNGLRTLSVRRNQLYMIPSWLCLLTQMEWLLVDDNPFMGPWKRLMDPLFDPVPATAGLYTPITPGPFTANSMVSSITGSMASQQQGPEMMLTEAEEAAFGSGDQTITLSSNPFPRAMSAMASPAVSVAPYHVYTPSINAFPSGPSPEPNGAFNTTLGSPFPGNAAFERPRESQPTYFPQMGADQSPAASRPTTYADTTVTRNRSTYADGYDNNELGVPSPLASRDHSREPPYSAIPSTQPIPEAAVNVDGRTLKKMKSADDVRKRNRAGSVSAAMAAATAAVVSGANSMMTRGTEPVPPMPSGLMSPPPPASPAPPRHALSPPPEMTTPERPGVNRFMSLGVRGAASAASSPLSHGQLPLANSPWEPPSRAMSQVGGEMGAIQESDFSPRNMNPNNIRPTPPSARNSHVVPWEHDDPSAQDKGNKKWGFLKKMSMGKMRGNNSTSPETLRGMKGPNKKRPATAGPTPSQMQYGANGGNYGSVGYAVGRSESAPGQDGQSSSMTPSSSVTKLSNMLKPSPSVEMLNSPQLLGPSGPTSRPAKRRSFLPLDTPPQLNIPIDKSPLLSITSLGDIGGASPVMTDSALSSARQSPLPQEITIQVHEAAVPSTTNESYAKALRGLMLYLKDMQDLGGMPLAKETAKEPPTTSPSANNSANSSPIPERIRRPTVNGWTEGTTESTANSPFASMPRPLRNMTSTTSLRGSTVAVSLITTDSGGSGSGSNGQEERKVKDDKNKRTHQVREILKTEMTYVQLLQELIDIYIVPSAVPITSLTNNSKGETVVPLPERKVVFNGLEALFTFHQQSLLPALARTVQALDADKNANANGELSAEVARAVADVFVNHAAFLRMYSTYINNFDNSMQRLRQWTVAPAVAATPNSVLTSPTTSTGHVVGLGLTMSAMGITPAPEPPTLTTPLTDKQRKRIKSFLKRCRLNPRHSQLNLEAYLLLPVQRIPRYKMMLENLVMSTPLKADGRDDPIERALEEISSLATNMNEGKRESESRKKLVLWQTRIKGKFPSPLVQPHRRLIMDGRLQLSRVVRKDVKFFEHKNPQGQHVVVQVECLSPEETPRQLVAILCNDLLVLCKDPTKGRDANAIVELWAVLRMQTLPQPASIYQGRSLRLVDHKAILYFDMTSTSEALTWSRAINMHIPASR